MASDWPGSDRISGNSHTCQSVRYGFLPQTSTILLGLDPCLWSVDFLNFRTLRELSMSRSIGNCIADSLDLCVGYAERLLKDVTAENFGRQASPGGTPIDSNHPAFVLGHLALYAPRILRDLGVEATAVPAGFDAVFSKDAKCADDPQATIYPPMESVKAVFFEGYRAASAALRAAADDTFQRPNPNPGRLAELFPSLGSMHAFYCGGHMMMHLGQLSAWRRMAGLGAA